MISLSFTGRQYHLTKTFQLEDAEIAIFALGTTYESAIVAASEMRKKGIKARRSHHPFLAPFPL